MKIAEMNVERVLTKLNLMLGKRYGVQVEFLPLYGAPKESAATVETVKRNAGAPMIVAHNKLIIPIRVEGVLAGATQVNEINVLQPKELAQVRETIDLIMTEYMTASRRVEILKMTEDLIRNEEGNVISIKRAQNHREVVSH